METFVRFIHVASLSFWVGGTLFLFVLAPGVFGTLPRAAAGDAMNAIFPRFYLLGWVAGPVALGTLLALPERSGARAALLVAMLSLLALGSQVIAPRIGELRERIRAQETASATPDPATESLVVLKSRFGKLHGASMAVFLAMFLAGLVLLWVTMASLTPLNPLASPAATGTAS